jgi:hypothetical protein
MRIIVLSKGIDEPLVGARIPGRTLSNRCNQTWLLKKEQE